MQVTTRTVRIVKLEATEAEWELIRQLIAEGLAVVETITPPMARLAEHLHLAITGADKKTPASLPPRRPRGRAKAVEAGTPAESAETGG